MQDVYKRQGERHAIIISVLIPLILRRTGWFRFSWITQNSGCSRTNGFRELTAIAGIEKRRSLPVAPFFLIINYSLIA